MSFEWPSSSTRPVRAPRAGPARRRASRGHRGRPPAGGAGDRPRYREDLCLDAAAALDRLGEITVPTLVLAGRDDFVFPPEHQLELAAGIPRARLRIIDRAGHNPHWEQTAEVMEAVRGFISADALAA